MNLLTLLLQTTDTIATPPVLTPVETANDLNLWDLACKGGIIMIPLLLLSLLSIYIFVERLQVIRRAAREDNSFMERIKDYIHEGNIDSALKLCKKTNTPYSRLIAKGISRLGRPMNDVLVAIENVGNLEVAQLEKGMVIMASISGGAPMLGFLGTVTGMVQTFYNMSINSSGMIQLSDLSSGMYQAMVTTIGGLIVGILAYFAYNYMVSRVDSVVRNLESKTMEFMDILNEPAK